MASSLTILSRARQLRKLRQERAAKRLPAPTATPPPSTDADELEAQRKASEAATELERWRVDPACFSREVLGCELWEGQLRSIRALQRKKRAATRSGHKVGKTKGIGVLAYWFVSVFPNSRVVITAPSAANLRENAWREIRGLWRTARRKPSPEEPPKHPATGVEWADGRQIVGLTTDEAERIAGISGENVLFLIDEASGVAQEIFEAIEGNRAGGSWLGLYGNPTQTSGEFYDAFHSKREFYELVHVSSEESPNVRAGRVVIPGLATREWVEEKRREWGPGSLLYEVRVAGNFPSSAADTVIPIGLLERMDERLALADEGRRLDVGVDVARFGDDDSVVAGVRALKGLPSKAVHGHDGPTVAGCVIEYLRKHRQGLERVCIKVDVIGYGASVYDHLMFLRSEGRTRELDGEVEIVDVNVAESPDDEDDEDAFERLRDQLWFAAADWFRAGGAIPPDPIEEAELVAPKYGLSPRGRRRVESKDSIKARLKRSPDRADARCLAIYRADLRSSRTPKAPPAPEPPPLSRWGETPGRGY